VAKQNKPSQKQSVSFSQKHWEFVNSYAQKFGSTFTDAVNHLLEIAREEIEREREIKREVDKLLIKQRAEIERKDGFKERQEKVE
jgi:macrodomain Ter protein organizer (MatP/YcbG family)